jgi:type IV pilus assembly protein PilY1
MSKPHHPRAAASVLIAPALRAALLAAGATALAASAALTDISSTPLSSASNVAVKPNLLFTLDSSGSMGWDFLPDNVDPDTSMNTGTNNAFTCRTDSNGDNHCNAGDPPYYANQFNGMFYNPAFTYRPGVNFDGTSRGAQVSPWTSVVVDSYKTPQTTIDLTTQFPEVVYCNGTGGSAVCKRNGVDNLVGPSTSFAYATPAGPSYTNVSFTRSGSTVTGTTTAPHSLRIGDVITVTGAGGCSAPAAAITTIPSSTTFTFVYGSYTPGCATGSVNYATLGLPEQSTPSFSSTGANNGTAGGVVNSSSRVVTVTHMNHGMVTGDIITVSGGGNACNVTNATVTGVNAAAGTFTYTVGSTNNCSGAYTISRARYNVPKSQTGRPFFFTIRPVEYCYDANLIDCKAGTAAFTDIVTGKPYTYPAYVRFCSSQALATQAVPVGDTVPTTGALPATPKCQSKYATINGVAYTYPRYGMFRRTDIVPATTTYGGTTRASRYDCASAPTCTFTEEMINFANWYTYYRTRIQTMKTVSGQAFVGLSNNYRIGFITINPANDTSKPVSSSNPVSSSRYLRINDFTPTQKQSFFSTFYTQQPGNSTPLRGALARAGRHFAGKQDGINSGMTGDPVQYSCQQNFTLLTTDGYWNTNLSNGDLEAVGLDGATVVGNQDNNLSRTAPVGSSILISTRDEGVYDGGCAAGNYSNGGCANTLADLALYYWANDLRPSGSTGALGTDVSLDNVPTTDQDPAYWQHMTTFTLGLADGLMTWTSDYETAATGDFANITDGVSGRCLWSTPGTCNWPMPKANTASALDDLWHAAVNGHGKYFHADNPKTLSDGLGSALAALNVRTAAAAASSTSSPNITQQSNVIYSSTYETVRWNGDLVAQYVDVSSGVVQPTILWSSRATLDGQTSASADSRTIYTFDNASRTLKPFQFASMTTAEQNVFKNVCAVWSNLTQCSTLSVADLLTINDGQTLVNFLRGQTGYEGTLFRDRQHVLGDTVDAQPVYVAGPRFNFADAVTPTYASFASSYASRTPVLYLAANDGMLHAFDARVPGTGGSELWAYVPRMLWSSLYRLSDTNYGLNHQFYVDGSPSMMDAFIGGSWRTVLVGGLNSGGRGYYALDITNPAAPTALWEFCHDATLCPVADSDLGLTYGNPVITKRASDGRWVVLVTSGYNNVSPGTGKEFLYVLDLATGAILNKIATGVGSTTTPGGLGKIAAWNDNPMQDNTTRWVYAGDLQGNVWRFDLGSGTPSVMLLAALRDGSGNAQPITTRPELANINGTRVLYVGSGSYLGNTDLSSTATQSMYAFKDTGTSYGNVRSSGALVQQTISAAGANTRTATNNAVDWTSRSGWYFDFPDTGERMSVDPQLVLGTLLLATNVPTTNACSIGGTSWLYQINYLTGGYVLTAPGQVVATRNPNAVTVGFVVVQLPTGAVKNIVTDATSNKTTQGVNLGQSPVSGRRVGWREMSQ